MGVSSPICLQTIIIQGDDIMQVKSSRRVLVRKGKNGGLHCYYTSNSTYYGYDEVLQQERLNENTHHQWWVFSKHNTK